LLAASTCLVATDPALAHGLAGKQFFPATLVIDDPFVADELSLPTIAYSKQPASGDSPATRGRASSTTVSDEGEVSVERHPHTLKWGFAVEYSVPYLQSFVQDVGLREPFNRMIPVVEFAMSTALDRGASGTTGTVNPGIIWAGQYVQLAVEASIPVNSRTGSPVGWIAQLHFFIDDLFSTTIGRPIIRNYR